MKKAKSIASLHLPQEKPKNCLMTICCGSPDQRGDRLRATLDAISEKFDHCTIIFADTLDRHNMMRKFPDNKKARSAAIERGQDWWRAYNKDVSERLPNRFSVIKWDRVLEDNFYQERRNLMQKLYDSNFKVRHAFDTSIEIHLAKVLVRLGKDGKFLDRDFLRGLSRNYLLEEYTGLTVIRSWTSAPEVYPGHCTTKDTDFFNRHNTINRSIDMSIPYVIGVDFDVLKQAA